MAANTRDIRRRIKSIKNTAQITKAMQMVAAAKMRKAQQAALIGRPYAELLTKVLASVSRRTDPRLSEFMEVRSVKKELILLVSTDKGLCGGLNSNLFRELLKFDSSKTVFVVVGRKGVQFVAQTRRELLAHFELKDAPVLLDSKPISKYVIEQFISREVDKVSVLYTKFVNTLTQKAEIRTLLPIAPAEIIAQEEAPDANADSETEYLFEPSANKVLDGILPHYVHFQVYQTVLNARASEHSARMVAMKNATDNAKQLIKDLTLEYNKIRQASITTELLEIATAQMAVG